MYHRMYFNIIYVCVYVIYIYNISSMRLKPIHGAQDLFSNKYVLTLAK